MKKIFFIIALFCLSLSNSIYAACTPDGSATGTGIHPITVSLDTGYVGANYAQTLTVIVPTDTVYQGFTVTVNTATISMVTGLPGTLSYSCTPTGCVFAGGTSGCMLIDGLPTATSSNTVVISVTLNVTTLIGTLDLPQDLTYTYLLEIVDTTGGGGCAVTASMSTTDETTPGADDGTATVSANGGMAPYSYLWSDLQTTSTAVGLAPGSYTVVITDDVGCTASGTATVAAAGVGISTIDGSTFEVYPVTPNPSSDKAEIRFTVPDYRDVSFSVHNMIGALVISKKIYAEKGLNIVTLNADELKPGVYFVTLNDGTSSSTKRMVVGSK